MNPGQRTIAQGGNAFKVFTNTTETDAKPGGFTIDWTTITAVVSDTTLPDGTIIKAGKKHARYGEVFVRITSGGSTGKWGPYAAGAVDGRQTVDATRRGEVYILDQTILEDDGPIQGPLFSGGIANIARVLAGGGGQVTLANLYAALPRLQAHKD